MLVAAVVLLHAVSDCPTAEISPAPTEAATKARHCFFGNSRAAEAAAREAADDAGCVQMGHPPVCTGPEAAAGAPAANCNNWANKLMAFYINKANETSLFSHLVNRARSACATSNGRPIPPALKPSVKPDSATPACHNIQPAAPADVAAFTAYMVVVSAASAYSLFENQFDPMLLFKEKDE